MDLKKQKVLRLEDHLVENLRPTQVACGWMEVKFKAYELLRCFENETLEEYLQMNAVPVVRDPTGALYMLDKHHFLCALYSVKPHIAVSRVTVKVMEDLQEEALPLLEQKGLLHLYDQHGEGASTKDLPQFIWDLQDDPMRSLAGFARKAGAFDKSFAPYSEFAWANYFRRHIDPQLVKTNCARALQMACSLSLQTEAQNIAGFHGQRQRVQLERTLDSLRTAGIIKEA